MIVTERGKIKSGNIVFSRPLTLPEGIEVKVQIESIEDASEVNTKFVNLPFFGMWADRDDINDSTEWVKGEREKWQHRAKRQD